MIICKRRRYEESLSSFCDACAVISVFKTETRNSTVELTLSNSASEIVGSVPPP